MGQAAHQRGHVALAGLGGGGRLGGLGLRGVALSGLAPGGLLGRGRLGRLLRLLGAGGLGGLLGLLGGLGLGRLVLDLLGGRLVLAGGALRRGGAAAGGAGADECEDGAHLDGVVLLRTDLQEGARHGGGDLGVDLVGGDLEQRLVDLDLVADGLQPAGHGALGHGLAQRGQGDLGGLAAGRRGPVRALVGGGALLRSRLACGLLLGVVLLRLLDGGLLGRGVVLRRVGGAAAGAVADRGQRGADLDRVVLLDQDLLEHAGHGGRDLGVDLVGGDLHQGLVDGDLVADGLEPAGHGALGDGFAQGGQVHGFRHGSDAPHEGWAPGAPTRGCEVGPTHGPGMVSAVGQLCSGWPNRAMAASPRASFCVGCACTNWATSSG